MNEVELYRRHRPTSLKGLHGQEDAVRVLVRMIKTQTIPHALLLTGNSGCGKTTTAMILKDRLECSARDFVKINIADSRGIDTIREIRQQMSLSPMAGKTRIWLLDEVHRATGDSMSALLEPLEFTPPHVYFILTTTDPQRLLPTIRTRCTEIKFKSLDADVMKTLLLEVCEKEGKTETDAILNRIIECAEGSARQALVTLHQVINLDTDEQKLNAILPDGKKAAAFDLVKQLLWEKADWKKIAAIISGLEGEDWEGLRYLILANASTTLLKGSGNAKRAYAILTAFEGNFYDSKRAGLVRACYEVIFGND